MLVCTHAISSRSEAKLLGLSKLTTRPSSGTLQYGGLLLDRCFDSNEELTVVQAYIEDTTPNNPVAKFYGYP